MSACLGTLSTITTEADRIGAWMQAQGAVMSRQGVTGIGLERDGQLVAGTLYDYYNGASMVASIAITGPITRRWLHAIFHYPFVHVGAQVLIGLVAEGNHKSIRLTEHLGFTRQTAIPHADPSGSLYVYAMDRADCRFLTGGVYV